MKTARDPKKLKPRAGDGIQPPLAPELQVALADHEKCFRLAVVLDDGVFAACGTKTWPEWDEMSRLALLLFEQAKRQETKEYAGALVHRAGYVTDPAEADVLFTRALKILRKHPHWHPCLGLAAAWYAANLMKHDRHAEALMFFEEAFSYSAEHSHAESIEWAGLKEYIKCLTVCGRQKEAAKWTEYEAAFSGSLENARANYPCFWQAWKERHPRRGVSGATE